MLALSLYETLMQTNEYLRLLKKKRERGMEWEGNLEGEGSHMISTYSHARLVFCMLERIYVFYYVLLQILMNV